MQLPHRNQHITNRCNDSENPYMEPTMLKCARTKRSSLRSPSQQEVEVEQLWGWSYITRYMLLVRSVQTEVISGGRCEVRSDPKTYLNMDVTPSVECHAGSTNYYVFNAGTNGKRKPVACTVKMKNHGINANWGCSWATPIQWMERIINAFLVERLPKEISASRKFAVIQKSENNFVKAKFICHLWN